MYPEEYKQICEVVDYVVGVKKILTVPVLDAIVTRASSIVKVAPKEARWAIVKYSAESSLYFWNKFVMGYEQVEPYPHMEMCSFLEFAWPKKLLLVPRKCYKTSLSCGKVAQNLAKDPNRTHILFCSSQDQSIRKTMEVRNVFSENKMFRLLYGDWSDRTKKGLKWTENQFDVAARTRTIGAGHYSVMGFGIESGRAGIHADEIIADDVHDEENTKNKDMIETTKKSLISKRPMLNQGGTQLVIGTRWHSIDTYAVLMEGGIEWTPEMVPEDIPKDFKGWLYYHRGCYHGPGKTKGLFFPAMFPHEVLDDIRADYEKIGHGDMFRAQYINEIVDPEHAKFKSEWLTWETPEENWEDNYAFDILIDTAYTDREYSDYTALIVVGTDKRNVRHVVDWEVFRTESTNPVLNRLYGMCERFGPRKIYMQKAASEEIYKRDMMDDERYRGWIGRIEHVSVGKESKNARIESLIRPFMKNRIRMFSALKNTPAGREFEEEYKLYPRAPRKDMLDALAMQNKIPPAIPKKPYRRVFWQDRIN